MPDDPKRDNAPTPDASRPEKTIRPARTNDPTPPADDPDPDVEVDKTDMSAVGDDGQVFGG